MLICTLLIATISNVIALDLSPNAEVSILTCSPGDDFYESYGHSAIRVKDVNNRIDNVYNYGTFAFSDDFAIQFMEGKLDYWVNVEKYPNFRYQYDMEKRSIYEQELNLNTKQKQQIFDFLTENAKEENKYYRYDFRHNNCSSKLRDVIEEAIGIQFSEAKAKTTYRKMIDSYVPNAEWYDFGTDLLLGAPIDKKIDVAATMFLPDYLMNTLDETQINGKPLVKQKQTLLDHGYKLYEESKLLKILTPARLFWILLIVVFLFKIYLPNNLPDIFSFLFLTIIGLAGWFMLYMWLGTAHTGTKWNLNILWAIPFHFPMAFFILKHKKPRWVAQYFFVCRVILITTLVIWPLFLPQRFHMAVLPLILLSLLCISSNIPVSMKIFDKK